MRARPRPGELGRGDLDSSVSPHRIDPDPRVLVTGSRGLVGSALVPSLADAGFEPVELDLVMGLDVLDKPTLEATAQGCGAVVHLAALLDVDAAGPGQLDRVNVEGTANALSVAVSAGIDRVVYMSSAAVLGVFKGHRAPDYLPLDAAHPCYPAHPYEKSKLQAEDLCARFGSLPGHSAIALRPPGVWTEEIRGEIQEARAAKADVEWSPYWEYGAFIDVRDLASAVIAALHAPCDSFEAVLVASSDISTGGRTTRELVDMIHPDVEWRGDEGYTNDPFKSLVALDHSARVLGWTPRHTWAAHLGSSGL